MAMKRVAVSVVALAGQRTCCRSSQCTSVTLSSRLAGSEGPKAERWAVATPRQRKTHIQGSHRSEAQERKRA